MLKNKKNGVITLILLILVATFFSVAIVNKSASFDLDISGESTQEILITPKTANGPPLSYPAIRLLSALYLFRLQ